LVMGSAPATSRGPRRRDLDLMRAAVVGGLVFFHTARIFDPLDFYIKSRPPNLGLTLFVLFAGLWGMPLLFVVSGLGAWHSLRSRTAAGFVRERLTRLLVPFMVGLLLIVPPQVYYRLRFEGEDPGAYWQFYQRFFHLRLDLNFPWLVDSADPQDLFEPAHLWFLYYLLVFSLLLLPLLTYLRGSGRRHVGWLASSFAGPWMVLLPGVPVGIIEVGLGTQESGGWNRYAFVLFLLYGFLIAADPRFSEAIRRHIRVALLLGSGAMVVLFGLGYYLAEVAGRDPAASYDGWSLLWRFLKAIGAWAWIIAIMAGALALVRRPWRRTPPTSKRTPAVGADVEPTARDRVVRYANEAVLPFYVLHQTVIVVIGFYVVRWDAGVVVKYPVISLTALLATLLVYEVGVRRANATRVLFGLRPVDRPATASR
jgi:glucan biosynthesis protein C